MGLQPRKLLERLAEFVDGFAPCFGRSGRTDSARRYVKGLFSDAKRKNMECMWGRITDPGDYQALQHFITHSTWSSKSVWAGMRKQLLDREGLLIVDDTGIPKRGSQSAGVARQYSGTLGKIGNCQVVVSCVLRSKISTWTLAMDLYLPEAWANDGERRESARIPDDVLFRKKWEIALGQIDGAVRSGIDVQCVVADAGYGVCAEFRDGLASRGLLYNVAITGTTHAFAKPPRFVAPTKRSAKGRTPTSLVLAKNSPKPKTALQIAKKLPNGKWKKVTWAGSKGSLQAEFVALRVTPSKKWYRGEQHDECWLICERPIGEAEPAKFYFSNQRTNTPLKQLVRVAHTRWAVEQNYEQLKDELALDHFEGRSYPGFHHHLVLTALAFTFLQIEKRRSRAMELPTLNRMRWLVTEIVTAQLFASDERLSRMITDFIRDPPEF